MATSLISTTTFRDFDDGPSPYANDDQVTSAIQSATAEIQRITGRDFQIGTDNDGVDILNGLGSSRIYLKNGIIQSITSVEWWNGEEWETLDTSVYDYTFVGEKTSTKVYFTDGNRFVKGHRNYRVTYKFGYGSGYPEDIKIACYMMAKWYIDNTSRQGINNQADGEQNFTYREQQPKAAINIIRQYITTWRNLSNL